MIAALKRRYPDAKCELHAGAPHELLIATILSAQSTDAGVNKATPALFRAFRTPGDYAAATPEAIGEYVKTVNFWRTKSRSIHSAMTTIVERFGGEVPRTMLDLLTLRGVARKTANVVLGECFSISEGIVVDTHVARLAGRFGLSRATEPARIESDLMALVDRKDWAILPHLLIWHGRRVCKARGGTCATDAFCGRYGTCAAESARAKPTKAQRSTASVATSLQGAGSDHRTGSSRSSPSRKRA